MLLTNLFVFDAFCFGNEREWKIFSETEIRKIADDQARRFRLNLSDYQVSFAEHNQFWKKHPVMKKVLENNPNLYEKVKGKEYFVFLYQIIQEPGFEILGGEYYVFIERNTGKILLEFAGK